MLDEMDSPFLLDCSVNQSQATQGSTLRADFVGRASVFGPRAIMEMRWQDPAFGLHSEHPLHWPLHTST